MKVTQCFAKKPFSGFEPNYLWTNEICFREKASLKDKRNGFSVFYAQKEYIQIYNEDLNFNNFYKENRRLHLKPISLFIYILKKYVCSISGRSVVIFNLPCLHIIYIGFEYVQLDLYILYNILQKEPLKLL